MTVHDVFGFFISIFNGCIVINPLVHYLALSENLEVNSLWFWKNW